MGWGGERRGVGGGRGLGGLGGGVWDRRVRCGEGELGLFGGPLMVFDAGVRENFEAHWAYWEVCNSFGL